MRAAGRAAAPRAHHGDHPIEGGANGAVDVEVYRSLLSRLTLPFAQLRKARPRQLRREAVAGATQPKGEQPQRLGKVAEWFKAAVLKTAVGASPPWVRIPPFPPDIGFSIFNSRLAVIDSVGGLVGYMLGGSISYAYATGAVTGASCWDCYVGGLVGLTQTSVTDSFWDINTTGQTSSSGGTGLTTAQMRSAASYTGWDFTSVVIGFG